MKFTTILFSLVAAFFVPSNAALQKTQEEAHQFLIDQNQVTQDSQVESFTLDRNGHVRIRLTDGDNTFSFGLEETQDTYDIVYMDRRKTQARTGTAAGVGTTAQKDELAKKIAENMSVLKGGKVTQIRRSSTRNKNEVEIEYKVGTKTYTITGHYAPKTGELSIRKIQDGALKATTATEL